MLDEWLAAHARAQRARDAVQWAWWRMKGAITLGVASLVATAFIEPLAIQVASGNGAPSVLAMGPYVVPIVGVIGAWFSFRTAFSEYRRHAEAEMVSVRAELDKKVAHDVLDAHLTAIRSDVGGLKIGMDGIRESLQEVAVNIGKLQGRAQ